MSDPIFCDPKEYNADVHDYARLLQRAARGHVLWEPSTVGQIGDCGQIYDGKFWKFFNVYEDPPFGLPRLESPTIPGDLRITVVENYDMLRSAGSLSVSFHGGLPFTAPPATLSINADFAYDRCELAFLGFGGPQRVTEVLSPSKTEALQRYLILNEKAIRSAVRILSGDIVILNGITRAPAWMGGVARRTSFELSSELSLNVGTISVDWGSSFASSNAAASLVPFGSAVTCAITKGPAGWGGTPSPRDDFTVVVRPIRVKRRQKIITQLMNLLTSSFVRTEGYFQPVVSGMTIPSDLNLTQGAAPSTPSSQDDNTSNSDMDSSFSSSSSTDDAEMEDDILGILLQRILDDHPSIAVVAGSWDVIANFLAIYGNDCLDSHVEATFNVDDAQTAFLVELSAPQRFNAGAKMHGITTSPMDRSPISWGSRRIVRVRNDGSRERDNKGKVGTAPRSKNQKGGLPNAHTECVSCGKLRMRSNVSAPNISCDRCLTAGLGNCSTSIAVRKTDADVNAHDEVAAMDGPIAPSKSSGSGITDHFPSCTACKRRKIACTFTPSLTICDQCVRRGLSECAPDAPSRVLDARKLLPEAEEAPSFSPKHSSRQDCLS